jgi:predicted lactoylglutathione lyase
MHIKGGVAMKSKFPGAVPEIPVRDINEAAAYYESSLGFTVDWGGEELGLAGISKGNCRMFLANSDYRKQRGNAGPVLIWLNLKSKDEVNDLYRLWSSSKAKLISEPESKPWGLHEFMAKDLDGNLFRVFYDFGTAESGNDA